MSGRNTSVKNKVILSFDDGRKDNYEIVMPLLEKYGITATFNIATAYVDGTIGQDDRPCPNEAMSVENVIEIYKAGHEIAAHGDRHRNEIEDIEKGIEKLRNWGVVQAHVGFASPNSKIPLSIINRDEDKLRRLGISYVRVGTKKNSVLPRATRKIGEITGNSWLYCKGFDCSPIDVDSDYILYSVPIMHSANLKQIQLIVNDAMRKDSDCILMFHSILRDNQPFFDDTWTWDYEKFVGLCKWLQVKRNSGEIDIGRD